MNGLNRRMLIGTAIGLLGAGVVLYIPPSVAFTAPPDVATYRALIEKLSPLHKPLGKPEPGDWLAEHKEAGQTFDEYIRSKPVVPSGKRTILYVQPLGDFTPKQREIVDATADFLGRYYVCTVKVNRDLPLSLVPDKARRDNPFTTKPQILSTFVFNDLLKPRLPDDALAMIALTASDLWPGEGWNYVFGQASTRDRVGVWSLHRFGNPEQGDESYRVCLLRTLKTASHETGHMISIDH